MQRRTVIVGLVVILFGAHIAYAGSYQVTRSFVGPFTVTISDVELNAGSSMQRESIILNEDSCPVQLSSHSLEFVYQGRELRYDGTTEFEVTTPIAAVRVSTMLFDVFNEHIKNLHDTEPRDMAVGSQTMSETWRAFDSDVSELLATVTYVARVRLADGTQWVTNLDDLQFTLSSLNLEEDR